MATPNSRIKSAVKPYVPRIVYVCRKYARHYLKRIRGYRIPSESHLSNESKEWFHARLRQSRQYLEFGSGGSTYFAAKLGIPFVTIESDSYFLESLKQKISNDGLNDRGRQKFLYVDIGLVGPFGYPVFVSERKKYKYAAYSDIPWKKLGNDFAPDLILIDGRFRIACALKTIRNLRDSDDWVMAFDDYTSLDRFALVEKFATLETMVGRLAIFRNKPEIDLKELECTILTYETDPK